MYEVPLYGAGKAGGGKVTGKRNPSYADDDLVTERSELDQQSRDELRVDPRYSFL